MADLDALDDRVKDLRCQFFNVREIADGRIDLPAFHALSKGLDLLQHIGTEHIMIHPVGLGADIGVGIVIHAKIHIRHPLL